jgi:hypothetical protein
MAGKSWTHPMSASGTQDIDSDARNPRKRKRGEGDKDKKQKLSKPVLENLLKEAASQLKGSLDSLQGLIEKFSLPPLPSLPFLIRIAQRICSGEERGDGALGLLKRSINTAGDETTSNLSEGRL